MCVVAHTQTIPRTNDAWQQQNTVGDKSLQEAFPGMGISRMDWESLKRFSGTAEPCGATERVLECQRKVELGSRKENPGTLF